MDYVGLRRRPWRAVLIGAVAAALFAGPLGPSPAQAASAAAVGTSGRSPGRGVVSRAPAGRSAADTSQSPSSAASAGAAGSTSAALPPPDMPALPVGVPPAGQNQFTDVAGSWAAGYIYQLQQAGVITVPADRRFHPNQPISRLDFAVWVSRALELPTPKPGAVRPFADEGAIPTKDQDAVAAAVYAGLVQGVGDNRFDPAAPINRAAIATIFGRALEAKGQTPDPRYFQIWADASSIPAWALPATVIMKDGLIYGEPCSPEACFAPLAPTTRAEAAAFIVRFMQYVSETYPPPPLPPPPPPTTTTPGFQLEAWYSDTSEGYTQLQQDGGDLTALIYGGYTIAGGGTLVGFDSPRTLAWARAHPQVPLWVMVQADSLGFLTNPGEQQSLIQAIVAMVQRAGYAGVNFDIEGVPGSEQQDFTAFITAAASALHANGVKVSVDVPTETAADLGQSWDAAYNYAALGQVVDQVIMMAYDYHYAGGTPGPISPISWERSAITYAESVMPASKVILGLPLYGYVWNTSTDAGTAYWESGMVNEAQANQAPIIQDPGSDESTFAYTAGGNTYVGWFIDGSEAADRLEMAHALGIGGVCVWRLDYGAPDWWPVFSQDLSAWR